MQLIPHEASSSLERPGSQAIVRQLQSLFISNWNDKTVFEQVLSVLLSLSGSERGFLGEVHYQSDRKFVDPLAIRSNLGSSDAGDTPHRDPPFIDPYRLDGLIAYVVEQQKKVMTGSLGSRVRSRRAERDPAVDSFLGVPLSTGDNLVGVAWLAGRSEGYDELLVERIQPILDCCTTFIQARQQHRFVHEQAQVFRSGFEVTPDAVVLTGPDGTVQAWNPGAVRLLGRPQEEALGKNLGELCGSSGKFEAMLRRAQEVGYIRCEVELSGTGRGDLKGETIVFPVKESSDASYLWQIRDISLRKRTEHELIEAGKRFEAFAQSSRAAFWITSADGSQLTYVSPAVAAIAGAPPSQFREARDWEALIHPDDLAAYRDRWLMYFKGAPARHRYRIVRRDAAVRWVESDVSPVKGSQGEISSLAGMWSDVTDLHQAEAELRTSLEVKETMLKETHHRIKNSLQVISSLLRLQASSTADAEAASILTESRNRVEVIALLHEHLYRSDSLMPLDFPAYVRRLIANLRGMHEVSQDNLRINLDVDPLVLDAQRAMVCGLIVNELVHNCLRHAFPDGRAGQIDVKLKADADRFATLSVRDTGVGMPSGFDIERAGTLGLRLVRQLTRQLKGKLSISRENHLTVQIAFPIEQEK